MPSSTSRRARGPTSTARTWRPPWPTSAAVRGASAVSTLRPRRTPRGGHEMSRTWIPRAMRQAPPLDPSLPAPPVERGRVLLINPFYAKDPHASFGKHVLTPTLALTSVAGATPTPWRVTYWDENLLAGRPPFDPMPEVVGITVHLTFARRAYALAAWYLARGARVILGGLHVLSCPDEAAPHADALAIGDGVQLWPRILADVERGGDARRDRRPEPRARDGAGRVHGRVHRVRVAQRREPGRLTQAHAAGRRAADYARRVRLLHDHGIQVNGSFVLGFDADAPEVFARTADWIEAVRLECATFHILTPYPGTPLFRRLEAEGRLLHREWELYDTAHVVFRPRRMTEAQLADGYAWLYRRLFSHASIWRRRPADWRAVAPYLAMSYLYKRSNRVWHLLIRANLTHAAWRPLVELTRRRHVRFRRRLVARTAPAGCGTVVTAGV